jgi:hypothetical protein
MELVLPYRRFRPFSNACAGRDRSIAEIRASRRSISRLTASMGPRSIDRGNANGNITKARVIKLQWGRDRSIAEI